ncbi:hypothetical protein DFH09DRAFT_288428 [Mycena vulgaris]|nr:hypothetical protein DFH09DRAFT_288428 [Mycena vulgaris]
MTGSMASSTTSSDSLRIHFSHIHDPDAGDESAGANLWTVYISEAEKYDKALVEGWKSDMEGLLIFAGLFSASLTAFLVESYKSLTPDQGAITIALLAQISRQLDAQANAPAADLATLTAFHPTPSSLACNIFWFLSLGFSLSCALIATLVEQWSRDFIQKTEMRPSPIIRARIFSYLYFGLQRFGMHTTVACLPVLLHVSLVLFFAGLVAFLQPINTPVMTIAALMLGFISATYAYLTVLPIYSSDCPYRTPLSAMAWALFLRLRAAFNAHHKSAVDEESTAAHHDSPLPKNIPTLTEAMTRDATQKSHHRDQRDTRAILWTVESLTDNNELEQFVEALPDLILGRRAYGEMINTLLEDRDIHLVSRIEGLLRSCDSGVLLPQLQTHRKLSCLKAMWSLADFVASDASTRRVFPSFDVELSFPRPNDTQVVNSHLISAYALVQWCGFCSVSKVVREALSMLESSESRPLVLDPRVCLGIVQEQARTCGYTGFSYGLARIASPGLDPHDEATLVQRSREALRSFDDHAYDTLMDYFRSAAGLDEMPYEFEATCNRIQPMGVRTNTAVETRLKDTFVGIIETHAERLRDRTEAHPMDAMVDIIIFLLRRNPESMDLQFSEAFVTYLNSGKAPTIRGLRRCSPEFIGGLLTKSLAYVQPGLAHHRLLVVEDIWTFCVWPDTPSARFSEATIAAVHASPFATSSCVIDVLKWHILTCSGHLPPDPLHHLMDTLEIPSFTGDTMDRWNVGHFAILLDFLEHYSSLSASVLTTWVKNQTVQTFQALSRVGPWTYIPPPLQRRFATWFLNVMNHRTVLSHASMIKKVIGWEGLSPENFDDPIARSTLREALTAYAGTLLGDDNEALTVLRSIDMVLSVLSPIIPATEPQVMLEITAMPHADESHASTSNNIGGMPVTPPCAE